MTLDAQQRMIFGAMCIDEEFRYALFEPPEAGFSESHYNKVIRLIRAYAETNEVVVADSVMQNVMNVVQLNSPCRLAAFAGFAAAKASVCPCWPCFAANGAGPGAGA
jgi:hypothetical protein